MGVVRTAAFGLALAAASLPAAATDVKFSLDWAFQGPQAPFLLALERGYFRDQGLNVTMDRGFGSGDVPIKIAAGTYDVGIADINPTIRLRLENPDSTLFTPFIIYEASPLAVMTLKGQNIRRPQDLAGKILAAPETDSGRQLFPAFARAVGLDLNSVRWQTVSPQLRETMLVQGQANAITGFITSGILSLRAAGVPADDIVTFRYGDYGVDLYSTSLLMTRRWAEANPRAVTGLITAIVRGQNEARRDPAAAIAALKRRDPLINEAVERERMELGFRELTFTPHVVANGFGRIDMARLQRSIDIVREAFNIARPLAASEIYDPRFLPEAAALAVAQ
ncbi:ABC transporter substrate-binding protein [Elioraea tepida]|jgi:NitT/TauT family transport system substrate-binding protein|uniref:Thiamine pyrimidine synthase n=1 Tax=Elioraea tepida TaxID=2843330 RepID=A0A975U2D8_9PROT|nr:ABC transporter substrate-binding protein [Elioraea tepida]QXM25156.1 ABC transporter substrate-binding protein [Elioraea tepida]